MLLLLLSARKSIPTGPVDRAAPDDVTVFSVRKEIYITTRLEVETISTKRS